MMDFDLRTADAALSFVCEFTEMPPEVFASGSIVGSGESFEAFWTRNCGRFSRVDISDIRILSFHVLGSLDKCEEIIRHGLKGLQQVLGSDTTLSRLLKEEGIAFDIPGKTVSCNGSLFDIDFEHYRRMHFLTGEEERLRNVAHRVYYDHCVTSFLCIDDPKKYGTMVHERPEFLMTMAELFPEAERVEHFWRSNSESYRVDFHALVNQVHRFNFELDEWRDPPYGNWLELDDDMKVKKWLLSHAIDRLRGNVHEEYLYIKDDVVIPPEQIISYTRI